MSVGKASACSKCIIGLFPELLGIGGVQEAGRLTALALHDIAATRPWQVELLSLNDLPGRHLLGMMPSPIEVRGFGRGKVRFTLSSIHLARLSAKRASSIVLAAHPHLAVPANWMRRVSPNLKIVVMAHGAEVWKPLDPTRRNALARSDLILAPSRYTAQKLSEVQGISAQKVHRLPWPLNPDFMHLAESRENLPVLEGFPQGRIILTVGRWASNERYKGTDELIHALAELHTTFPDLHLVAVGGGDDLPRLRALVADLGLESQVHFLEKLSREQIATCYAHSDIFALPSTGEGFGLVFLEAMAFAKPVVGVAAGGATDVIEHGINGFLVPLQDSPSLKQTLERLLRDESLRAELGDRGARIVRETYAFSAFRDHLERILIAISQDHDLVVGLRE